MRVLEALFFIFKNSEREGREREGHAHDSTGPIVYNIYIQFQSNNTTLQTARHDEYFLWTFNWPVVGEERAREREAH